MTENTKNKFAELLKAANQKANIPTKINKPVVKPEPQKETKQELSLTTIDDLLNDTSVKATEEKPNLRLIDYSDKAFAVIGDTKPIKDQLKSLGGRFNMYLTCGAGWIYPKTKAYTVRKALNLI